jgi:uncharacterized glyoxalase superfamily protein PhnB
MRPPAIRFLGAAFALAAQEIDEGSDGRINHALLRYGASLVMVSSRRPGGSPFDHGTSCLYVAVDDPDAHHARATAAGARIVQALVDQPYGSREYAASDPPAVTRFVTRTRVGWSWFPAADEVRTATVVAGRRCVGSFRVLS